MESQGSFNIDLANPASISEKLPEAEAMLKRLQEQYSQKREELVHWQNLVTWLQALERAASGEAVAAAAQDQHLTELQALVVGVVNREVRRIRAKDVTDILHSEGHDISGDTVSNTLWYVAEKITPKPIQRAGRGFYAPLAYKGDETTAGEAAASLLAGAGLGVIAAGAAHGLLKAGGGG
jgi:hypothetical protein